MLKTIKLYKGKEELKFDTEKHRYWNGKGDYLLSVTAATGVLDKPALLGWAVKEMGKSIQQNWDIKKQYTEDEKNELIEKAKKEYRWVSKKAMDIGKEIHKWVEDWINGEKPVMPTDEKVLNGVNAFLKYQKEHKVKWIVSEKLVYSKKHKYAGTLDAIGKIDGKTYLIDFKSSTGIYDEMIFQTAGYQIAYEEESNKKLDGRMILRFGKNDGAFEVKMIDSATDDRDRKCFLACLTAKRTLNELRQEWKEANK